MEIKRVGVIGAGQMGNGIAHVFALAGYDVLLHDVSERALDAAPGVIRRQHRPPGPPRQDHARPMRDAAMGRIRIETEPRGLGQTDLVIEAATEREPLKHQIFKALLPHLRAAHAS